MQAASRRRAAVVGYNRIVEQARRPVFYERGVPDTPDGRFDMLIVHLYAVLRRLRGTEAAGTYSQDLFDVMASDIDANLREMGVGDTKVGEKVRDHAERFYGRAGAYDRALDEEGAEPLQAALARNLFGDEDHPEGPAFAAYLKATLAALVEQAPSAIAAGRIVFPAPPAGPSAPADHREEEEPA